MFRSILIIMIGAGFAWMLAYLLTYLLRTEGRIKSRGMSYFLSMVFVFVASVIWAAMAPETVYPGEEIGSSGRLATEYHQGTSPDERYDIAQRTFFITIVPALVGVRMALGRSMKQ